MILIKFVIFYKNIIVFFSSDNFVTLTVYRYVSFMYHFVSTLHVFVLQLTPNRFCICNDIAILPLKNYIFSFNQIIDWPNFQTQQAISRDKVEFLACMEPWMEPASDLTHHQKETKITLIEKSFHSFSCRQPVTVTWSFVMHTLAAHAALMIQGLFEDGEQGNVIGQGNFIIGDSAYPLRNWLIIPFRNTGHLTPRQKDLTGDCRMPGKQLNDTSVILRGYFEGYGKLLSGNHVRQLPKLFPGAYSKLCVLSHEAVEDFVEEDHDVNANVYPNIYLNGECGAARRNEIINALL